MTYNVLASIQHDDFPDLVCVVAQIDAGVTVTVFDIDPSDGFVNGPIAGASLYPDATFPDAAARALNYAFGVGYSLEIVL